MGNAVRARQGGEYALTLSCDLFAQVRADLDVCDVVERVSRAQFAVGQRAEQVVVRHAGHVSGGVQAGDRGFAPFVDPDSRAAMPAAQPNLRDVHLDHVLPVALAAPLMEASAARSLGAVQHALDLGESLWRQVVELEIDG